MQVLGIIGDKIPAFRYEHLVNSTGGGPESPHLEYLGANHSIKVQQFFFLAKLDLRLLFKLLFTFSASSIGNLAVLTQTKSASFSDVGYWGLHPSSYRSLRSPGVLISYLIVIGYDIVPNT